MTHILRFVGIVLCVQLYLPPAAAQDQHDLYYYLTPKSEETYNTPSRVLPGSDHDRRLGFVVGLPANCFPTPRCGAIRSLPSEQPGRN